ncbi:hypothetical protein OL548_10815 [Lysinibacillus sp. MHQ-1]|nr:hypothetical protein OL548_10815 [Lysinibacillus sp. MHQ-1]
MKLVYLFESAKKLVELYSEIAQQGYGENDMSAAYLSLKDTCKIKQL